MGSIFSASADHVRIQTIQLEAGWNAVHLAVEPSERAPDVLFADTGVDIVATYDTVGTFGQFSTDPAVDMLRQLGWGG